MKRMLAWLYAPLVFAGFIGAGVWWMSAGPASASGLLGAVSYTHLTLPTSDLV